MPAGVGGKGGAWRYLWALPQAVAWEELEFTRVVARYAVVLVATERPGAPAALLAEVRQLEDRLGLNAVAMKRLMWEVVDSAGEVVEEPSGKPVASLDAYRERAAR